VEMLGISQPATSPWSGSLGHGCTSNAPTSHVVPPGRGSPRWSVVQRVGGALNLNVHFHTLVVDGVFDRERAGMGTLLAYLDAKGGPFEVEAP
jgi:hypothetical protein